MTKLWAFKSNFLHRPLRPSFHLPHDLHCTENPSTYVNDMLADGFIITSPLRKLYLRFRCVCALLRLTNTTIARFRRSYTR